MGMPSEPHLEGGPGSKICRKSALHFAGISPDMVVCRFHMFSPIVWRFLPPTRLIHSNSIDAFPFDNECLQLPFSRRFFGSAMFAIWVHWIFGMGVHTGQWIARIDKCLACPISTRESGRLHTLTVSWCMPLHACRMGRPEKNCSNSQACCDIHPHFLLRNCSGQFLVLHRPTHDRPQITENRKTPRLSEYLGSFLFSFMLFAWCFACLRTCASELNASGKYRYGKYFAGKKWAWHVRMQSCLTMGSRKFQRTLTSDSHELWDESLTWSQALMGTSFPIPI